MRGQLASGVRLLGYLGAPLGLQICQLNSLGLKKIARNIMFKGQPPPQKNHTCEDCRCPRSCLCFQIWGEAVKPCFPMVLHVKLTSRLQEIHKTQCHTEEAKTHSRLHTSCGAAERINMSTQQSQGGGFLMARQGERY